MYNIHVQIIKNTICVYNFVKSVFKLIFSEGKSENGCF